MSQCIGSLATDGLSASQLVRNTGGGTAACCSMHPIAAPASIVGGGDAMELILEPLEPGKSSRNGARVYLADTCVEGNYADTSYAAEPLVGKTFSVTVDVSGAECGCIAAVYLVSMASNQNPGTCDGDFYCDANNVCGVLCTELDLMEASKYAFHATFHTGSGQQNEQGAWGYGAGVGGTMGGIPNDGSYGPYDHATIDTRRPFRVHSYFRPSGANVDALVTTLTQGAGRRISFTFLVSWQSIYEISGALRAGMTPTFSYWSAADMSWFDSGVGCAENQALCGDRATYSELAVCDGPGDCDFTASPSMPPDVPPPGVPPPPAIPPFAPPDTPPPWPAIPPSTPPPPPPPPPPSPPLPPPTSSNSPLTTPATLGGAQLALQATAGTGTGTGTGTGAGTGTGTGTGSVSSHSGLILTACFLVGFVVSQALLLYLAVRSHRRRRIPVRSRVAEPSYWRRHRDHESKHEADAPQLPAMADHAQALGGEDHATVAGG